MTDTDRLIPWPEICAAGGFLLLDNGDIPDMPCYLSWCKAPRGHQHRHTSKTLQERQRYYQDQPASRRPKPASTASGLNPNRTGAWWNR